jgi:nitroreductase
VASALEPSALDQLFRTARTFNEWSDTPIDERVVRELYDLLKWGPTSANSCAIRLGSKPRGEIEIGAARDGNEQSENSSRTAYGHRRQRS